MDLDAMEGHHKAKMTHVMGMVETLPLLPAHAIEPLR
jgi:hypothetical protein